MKKILFAIMPFMMIMFLSSCRFSDKSDIENEIKDGIMSALSEINDSTIRDIEINLSEDSQSVSVSDPTVVTDENGLKNINVNVYVDDSTDENILPIVAVVLGCTGFFGLPVAIIWIICYFIFKTKRDRNRIISQSVQTGNPLPEGFFVKTPPVFKLQNGFSYIAWGLGTMIFFCFIDCLALIGISAILIVIGLGKIVGWYITERKEKKNQDNNAIDQDLYHNAD